MTPTPEAPAQPSPAAKNVFSSFVTALFDHTPDSLRRLGAAITLVVVPFMNAYCQKSFGFSVPDTQVLVIESGLALYITQSFAKAFKVALPVVPALLAVVIASSSCAHASPARVTGAALSAADIAFEAVAAGMQKLSDQNALTFEQATRWNVFLSQYQLNFTVSKKLWQTARENNDTEKEAAAAAALDALLSDLAFFEKLVGFNPNGVSDGGAS